MIDSRRVRSFTPGSSILVAMGLVGAIGLGGCGDSLTKPIQVADNDTTGDIENPDLPDRDGDLDGDALEDCDLECPEGRVDGACQCKPREGCACEDPDRTVCGTDGNTYRSPCEAACHFAGVASEGACPVACPAIACANPCPQGYKKDANGCDTCECLDCEPVLCDLACPNGFARGPDGCEICQCAPAESDLDRPDQELDQEPDRDPDPTDTEPDRPDTDEGPDGDRPICMPIDCARCPDGQTSVIKYDEWGCAIGCECQLIACPPIACPDNCPAGCEVDDNGCVTGRCRPAPSCQADFGGVCSEPGPDDGIRCPPGMQPLARGGLCPNLRQACCVQAPTCSCDLMYAPVCGVDGVTYPNRCHAQCVNASIAYEGECRPAVPCGANGATCPPDQRCFTPTAGGPVCVPGSCGTVACRCAAGYRSVQFVGGDGCPSCTCVPEPCPDVDCDLWCPCGYATDARGCSTCSCLPCPEGCGDGPACPPELRCVECPIDPNCPQCDWCPPAICVPNDGCTYHSTDGVCVCFGNNEDCPRGQICDMPPGAPYGKCSAAPQNACQQRGGTCIAVTPNARCPAGTQLSPTVSCGGLGSACCLPVASGCRSNADCAAGQICVDGTCRATPQCTTDANCPRGYMCLNGRCEDRCALIDCAPGYICQAGQCILDPNQNLCQQQGGTCGRMTSDGRVACPSGSQWDGGRLPCQGQATCCLQTVIGCSGSGDCPAGQACVNGRCVAQTQCDAMRPCPPNAVCRDGVCVPVEAQCTQDDQCPAGNRCIDFRCQPLTSTCRVNTDCPAGEQCVNGSCVPVLPGDTCTPRGGLCVAPSPDGQFRCPAGTAPLSSATCGTQRAACCMAVEPECRSDRDCPAGNLCDRLTGTCVPEPRACENDGGTCVNFSAPGARCPAGTQVAGDSSLTCQDPSSKCCAPCACPEIYSPVCGRDLRTYSNDCELQCAQVEMLYRGECRAGGCLSDADCDQGRVCDLATFTCRAPPAACATDRDCPVGQVCDRATGTCIAAPPAGCRTDTDCETGERCIERICRAGCQNNDQCALGQVCRNGACTTVSPCEERGYQCADGTATGGRCPAGLTAAPPTGDNTCAAPGAVCCTTCLCTRELNPVCGSDRQTYPNPCYAECAGVRYTPGECPPRCTTQADCPQGMLCDTRDGACYRVPASCTNSNQCPGSLLCLSGRCMNRPAGCTLPPVGVGECVCSNFGTSCPAGWTCVNQQCAFGQCVGTCQAPSTTNP